MCIMQIRDLWGPHYHMGGGAMRINFFLTQFLCQAIFTQRTPEGTQVIVGSMNTGYNYTWHCQEFKGAATVKKMEDPNRAKLRIEGAKLFGSAYL